MKFTLELNAYELREAGRTGLLDAVACLEVQETPAKKTEPAKTEQPAVSEAPTAVPPQQEPTPQAAAIPQQAQPARTPQDPAAAVPVQAVSYTMEQLALAATQLMDANKKQAVLDLLAKYGVQALTMLPKERYGAFATDLRALGAKL